MTVVGLAPREPEAINSQGPATADPLAQQWVPAEAGSCRHQEKRAAQVEQQPAAEEHPAGHQAGPLAVAPVVYPPGHSYGLSGRNGPVWYPSPTSLHVYPYQIHSIPEPQPVHILSFSSQMRNAADEASKPLAWPSSTQAPRSSGGRMRRAWKAVTRWAGSCAAPPAKPSAFPQAFQQSTGTTTYYNSTGLPADTLSITSDHQSIYTYGPSPLFHGQESPAVCRVGTA